MTIKGLGAAISRVQKTIDWLRDTTNPRALRGREARLADLRKHRAALMHQAEARLVRSRQRLRIHEREVRDLSRLLSQHAAGTPSRGKQHRSLTPPPCLLMIGAELTARKETK